MTLAVSFLEIYCDRVRDLAREYVWHSCLNRPRLSHKNDSYLKKAHRQVSYQNSSTTEWFLRQVNYPNTKSLWQI